jgi:UDP-N-acetylglucosamine 2-epimerase
MGEHPETVLSVGCPSSDIAAALDRTLTSEILNSRGSGGPIDVSQPYQLVIFHPTTTEYGGEQRQMQGVLQALQQLQSQTVLLWPNIDAGSDHVSWEIRRFRDQYKPNWLRTLINLSPEDYLKVLANAACAIGNSSSFVRDASYFGTPVVLVGNRQEGRETDRHVIQVAPLADQIEAAVREQLRHGRYRPSTLYGDGNVAQRVAEGLATLKPYIQKRLHYIYDETPKPRKRTRAARGEKISGNGAVKQIPTCASSES